MGRTDRKILNAHISTLEPMLEQVQNMHQGYQEVFEAKSAGYQEGDSGQAMQSMIEAMDQAASNIQEAIDNLQSAVAGE